MKLTSMAHAVRELMDTAPGHQLSFDEKLGIVVDREWSDRDNRRLSRRLKDAKLATRASLDNVLCDAERGIDKATMRGLASCRWIKSKHNIVIVGKTGVGKSYVASALADAACRDGYRAIFFRVPRLLEELALARASGVYASLLLKLSRFDVLVLDDFLLNPMTDVERRDLLEVIEDRYDKTSTVVATQMPTKTWHEGLGDERERFRVGVRCGICSHRRDGKTLARSLRLVAHHRRDARSLVVVMVPGFVVSLGPWRVSYGLRAHRAPTSEARASGE